ncbi:hypothetical protein MES5069_360137 [Mesorhizobium escarrei]|uniref:Transposase n=1 Tax=Mesorhizobium escarrei TaxID=666018 RepID=A0ABN8JYG0_9HYPH|nr:hypothetical protein MES5069_360137 [Mesorhizobium escarrei]
MGGYRKFSGYIENARLELFWHKLDVLERKMLHASRSDMTRRVVVSISKWYAELSST